MRTKLVVGNWKMNMTISEATAAVEALQRHVNARADVDTVICPPYLSIPRVRDILRNTCIKVGAQDVFWMSDGAFTSQVSARMLNDVGCSYCIVGHSETRGKFGKVEVSESTIPFFAETDETVNLKIKALLMWAINPIMCVGETLAEREAGHTDAVIEAQLRDGLDGIDPAELSLLSIAYEPVWAIGTGNTCDVEEAERVCAMIRQTVCDMGGEWLADLVRVLYGGSVKPSNSRELFSQPNIDGGLVGGASLDPTDFSIIVMSA